MKPQLDRDDGERLCAIASVLEHGIDYPDDGRDARFLRTLGERAIREAPEDGPVIHLPRLLGMTFGISTSEARRLLATGGVRIGGRRVSDLDVPRERVDGRQIMIGLKRAAVIDLGRLEEPEANGSSMPPTDPGKATK